ncbi:M20/M25/M40 family metallo-hydrolase [Ilumatobacter coccineus]|uniref:Peptidase M20 family protein n=1 Tax=Ilumatobacter coccineus (strain NBRC 103263 / KCTC 29153 / YM16-304) TaxID=1313172 RepID=A0A6C7E5C1_ILUCY|nr:M20/M25/M40 family metallo-hydrolase [Ilumatobacter coccineus]BAN02037.1 peptidase M20 family protein [Ilumatobacter coccineus YM16-304]
MGATIEQLGGETVELLQQMIRNQCVNDGTPESGHEHRTATLLRDEIEQLGIDHELIEVAPGRTSLVARHAGTDPTAPALCLMGHTDVVPASPEGWRHDPFGGEIIVASDGTPEVWGRGAVDMLNLTSSMFVAFREIVRTGKRHPGDLVYFAVADEEEGGALGAKDIVANSWDAVRCDYVLTEYGGTPSVGADGTTVLLTTGEKQAAPFQITVHGTPGHGSMPYATDNALVKAAKIVSRIAEHQADPLIDEMFTERIRSLGLGDDLTARLIDPAAIDDALAELPTDLARNVHSCCHTTFSSNVMRAGRKGNTVPDKATVWVDIRLRPGENKYDAERQLREIIGDDLAPSVDVEAMRPDLPESNPFSSTDTPMWDALADSIRMAYPDAKVIPSLVTGATDARFFRQRGVQAYGAGLLSNKVSLPEFLRRFHGNDERIDIESLQLTTQMWLDVCNRLWH